MNSLETFLIDTFPMGEEVAKKVASNFKEIEIRKNEYLLKEGQINTKYVFLKQGFIRAYTLDTTGDEVTTAFYSGNQIVYDVASYFLQRPSKENLQALTDCVCFVAKKSDVEILFHSTQEFREFGRTILVKGFVRFKERTLSMISETAEERYLALITSNPALFQHVPLKYIASYLGVTDTSLSRIRKDIIQR